MKKLPFIVVFLLFFVVVGCMSSRPETIIVSEDMGLVKMEWNGVPGWWAPQATWTELLSRERNGE